MIETNEVEAVCAVIQEYVDACAVGSVARLKALFHEQALMSGYMMGEYVMGSPEPFFQALENPPPDLPASEHYKGEIRSVEVSGPIASVALEETGFMGMNFSNYFHLARVDGQWLIISKTFNPETD